MIGANTPPGDEALADSNAGELGVAHRLPVLLHHGADLPQGFCGELYIRNMIKRGQKFRVNKVSGRHPGSLPMGEPAHLK